jgi:hypothetical protein
MALLTANRPGGVIALVGGVLTGLAYLLLPVANVPLIGSITAPSLAGQASDTPSLGLLPLVPVASVVTIAVGLWLALAAPKGRARVVGAVGVLVCAALTSPPAGREEHSEERTERGGEQCDSAARRA